MHDTNPSEQIDAFVEATRRLDGEVIDERRRWNSQATADAIRHFALGTSDDNPLWADPEQARRAGFEKLVAPPAFLASVCYPVLHGAPVEVPLASLIGDLGFEWFLPILEGDEITGRSVQKRTYESRDRKGRRMVCIESETTYRNQHGQRVGVGRGTLVRVAKGSDELLHEREVHRYGAEEIEEISRGIRGATRSGEAIVDPDAWVEGDSIPRLVRPPLSIGDLVAWQAGAGTASRAGSLGLLDTLASPHTAVTHPLTGWPLRNSQQHEDPSLARQRGMPAPFDNGVMRLAWLAPLLTNWMGDRGFLKRFHLNLKEPMLFGDVSYAEARIVRKVEVAEGVELTLRVEATNQLGRLTTSGEALVWLPVPRKVTRSGEARRPKPLSADDRLHWLEVSRGPDEPVVADATVHAAIEAHANVTPDACAIRAGERCISYGQLLEASEQVARRVRAAEVVPGELVALRMGRSPAAIIAMLGVLRAGAAYLPLEPENPRDVLGAMSEAHRPRLLLVDRDDASEQGPGIPRLEIGDDGVDPGGAPTLPPLESGPADPAYAIATSGSLGEPKLVSVSHGSLALYLHSLPSALDVGEGDTFLHTASFEFSAAVRQTWLPLILGAPLVLADRAERSDPAILFRRMGASQVTVWDTVPSWFAQCVDRFEGLAPPARRALLEVPLRRVLLTGEPLRGDVVRGWYEGLGQSAEVRNLYSQTEACGTASVHLVSRDEELDAGPVPVGTPMPHTRIHVLGEDLEPLPHGEVGEICVAGDRIATGYLGDPEATARAFVSDPFVEDRDARMVRTGDLGRIDAHGRLEHLGRRDRRVDIRGFRVELGEIEAVLVQHPEIASAAVVHRGEGDGRSRLVAYVVPHGSEPPGLEALHDHLRARLPSHMIPATTLWLDELPRTASGKLDRRALPEPSRARPLEAGIFAAPTTPAQEQLASLWASALGVERVGIDDDFFAYGGDSLRAISLLVDVEQQVGGFHPLEALYEAPTVRAFAARLDAGSPHEETSGVVALHGRGSRPPLFWLPGGGGHPFAFRAVCLALGDDQPSYGLTLPGLEGREAPLDRVEDLAAHFVERIDRVRPDGPVGLVGYSFGGYVAYEIARVLQAAGREIHLLGILDTRVPGALRRRRLLARLGVHRERWSRLGAAERWRYLGDLARRRVGQLGDGSPPASPTTAGFEEAMRLVSAAKTRAARRYRPGPYEGSLTLFRADPEAWMDFVEIEEDYGWGALCGGGVECRPVTGRHLEILSEPHVASLAASLHEVLARR